MTPGPSARSESRRPASRAGRRGISVAAARAVAAAVATATATAAVPAAALVRLVHPQQATLVVGRVQLLDRLRGFRVGAHLHEAESPRAAGVAVVDDRRRLARADRAEELAQVVTRNLVGEVRDV